MTQKLGESPSLNSTNSVHLHHHAATPNGILARALVRDSFAIASTHTPVIIELENSVPKPSNTHTPPASAALGLGAGLTKAHRPAPSPHSPPKEGGRGRDMSLPSARHSSASSSSNCEIIIDQSKMGHGRPAQNGLRHHHMMNGDAKVFVPHHSHVPNGHINVMSGPAPPLVGHFMPNGHGPPLLMMNGSGDARPVMVQTFVQNGPPVFMEGPMIEETPLAQNSPIEPCSLTEFPPLVPNFVPREASPKPQRSPGGPPPSVPRRSGRGGGEGVSLAVLHERMEKSQLSPLVESVLHLPRSSQKKFLTQLCGALPFESLLHVRHCVEDLVKRDFISCLPPEIVKRILSFVDVKTQGRMSLVCKKWKNSLLAPLWRTACLRNGITVTSNKADYWIERYRRSTWRLRSWSEDPSLSVVPVFASSPGDQETLCFIPPLDNGPTPYGYISACINPGMTVFYPESEAGGATYFLRTGPALAPTVLTVFGGLAILGFGNGSVQQWDWKQNILMGEIQNASLTPVTALDYSENWDLLAIGSEDSSVHIWRASTCELLSSFCDSSQGSPGGLVRKLGFVDRTLYSSVMKAGEGEWSQGEEEVEETYKLFLVCLYEVQSISFMFGSKRRTFTNLLVWDVEPYSGNVLTDIYVKNSGWENEGIKDSLEIVNETGTVMFLSTYDFGTSTYNEEEGVVTVLVHEFDPIGEEEFVSSVMYEPMSPMGSPAPEGDIPGMREWQILGVGRRFMALGVWELNRNEVSASTVSALLIYERVTEQEETRWVRVLALTPAALTPDYGLGSNAETPIFGAMVLGRKSWLDGFDGENDSGLLFAGAYWDFLQGGWRVKCFNWREPGQGPFGYCVSANLGS